MGRQFKFVAFMVKLISGSVIFACLLLTVWTVGPTLETALFPVVSKLDVDQVTQDKEGNSVLLVSFTKLRNCEYLGISWFKGKPNGYFTRVPVTLGRAKTDESSPNRPLGHQSAGPWTIGLTNAELRDNSFAQLSHRCHPFWTTTTDFYP